MMPPLAWSMGMPGLTAVPSLLAGAGAAVGACAPERTAKGA